MTTEAFIEQIAFEGCHGLPEAVNRPTIVAPGLEDSTKLRAGPPPGRRGEREVALGGDNGLVMRAHDDMEIE
jgi:hypothetical protein